MNLFGHTGFWGFIAQFEIDRLWMALLIAVLFVLLIHLFLLWLVKKAIAHKFSVEFRIPSLLFFRINVPKSTKQADGRTYRAPRVDSRKADIRRSSAVFGDWLRKTRIGHRVTLHQLSERLNIPISRISKIEDGTSAMPDALAEKIPVCLNLSDDEFSKFKELFERKEGPD